MVLKLFSSFDELCFKGDQRNVVKALEKGKDVNKRSKSDGKVAFQFTCFPTIKLLHNVFGTTVSQDTTSCCCAWRASLVS